MRWALLALLALLFGCAPGARGPLLAPPMSALRPGYGLPLLNPEPERPPRSPHKRVLPPTRGPAIWAGDEPTPKTTTHRFPLVDQDEDFPLPADHDFLPVKKCAAMATGITAMRPGLQREVANLTPAERKCYGWLTFHECIDARRREFLWAHDAALRSKTPLPVELAWEGASIGSAWALAGAMMEVRCGGGVTSVGVLGLFERWQAAAFPRGRGGIQ